MLTDKYARDIVASENGSHGIVEIVNAPDEQQADGIILENNFESSAREETPAEIDGIILENNFESSAREETQAESLGTSPTNSESSTSKADVETRIRHLKLHRAAFKDDWRVVDDIYKAYPNEISARITKEGDTALHIAV